MFDFLKRKRKKVQIEGVYAGPEQMGRPERRPDAVMGRVYAGPEPPKMPEKDPDRDAAMEDVYGGPSMMGELGWDVEETPEADPGQGNPMGFVYAGPGQMFRGEREAGGFTEAWVRPYPGNYAVNEDEPAQESGEAGAEGTVFCPICGRRIADGQEFCPECGSPIRSGNDEQPEEMFETVYAGPEYFGRRST